MTRKKTIIIETIGFTSAFFLFGMFVNTPFPISLFAVASMIGAMILIIKDLLKDKEGNELLRLFNPKSMYSIHTITGILTGVIFAFFLRSFQPVSLLPTTLYSFALLAVSIGIAEEIVFRGYLQQKIRKLSMWSAIIVAALGHTLYKISLFILPDSAIHWSFQNISENLFWLGTSTLIGGGVFGILRELSASIYPPLFAHAFFDLLAYGDQPFLPWWV